MQPNLEEKEEVKRRKVQIRHVVYEDMLIKCYCDYLQKIKLKDKRKPLTNKLSHSDIAQIFCIYIQYPLNLIGGYSQ